MLLSICIPTYQRKKFLKRLLDQLITILKPYSEEIEICVSDNHSTDGTYELLKNYKKKYAFIKINKNKKNEGVDKNIFKVLSMGSGKYLWLVPDDDVVIKSGMEKLIKELKKGEYGAALVAAGRKDFVKRLSLFFPRKRYESLSFLENYKNYFQKVPEGDEGTGFMPCFLIKRDLFFKEKFKVKKYGWSHLAIFLSIVSNNNCKVLIHHHHVITTEKEGCSDKIFLPPQNLIIFFDNRIKALEQQARIEPNLIQQIKKRLEERKKIKYILTLIKTYMIKKNMDKNLFKKISNDLKEYEKTIPYNWGEKIFLNLIHILLNIKTFLLIFEVVQKDKYAQLANEISLYKKGKIKDVFTKELK